jgi:hypothetical protein
VKTYLNVLTKPNWQYIIINVDVAESPSGKAPASGAGIRGFKSSLGSQKVDYTKFVEMQI